MTNILIFDYDGVIIDSLDIFMENFIHACKKEGFPEIASKKEFLELFEKNMYESMFEIGMTKEQILRIVYFMRDQLIKNQDKIKIFPDIKETLKKLSEENILVIVTSNDTNVVEKFLKSKNLEYFDETYGSDKEPSKIVKIKKIKQKYPKSNYYYIGDTAGDIIEGKKAGINTVAVTWGWHPENKLKANSPDFLIKKPEELLNVIKKII